MPVRRRCLARIAFIPTSSKISRLARLRAASQGGGLQRRNVSAPGAGSTWSRISNRVSWALLHQPWRWLGIAAWWLEWTKAPAMPPAPPTTSASTDAVPIESSSTAPALTPTSVPTAKVSAMDTTLSATGTTLAAKETVPATEETSTTAAMDKKSASKQDDFAEAAQEFVKPKVVEKVLELPVVNDTYDSLV